MTDEELDALVQEIAKLAWSNADVAATAITTLRAQLAEANARADRAEAALTAQIEADAGIADDHTPEKHSGMTLQAHVTGKSIAAAIRAQPHDRSALDRMLAEARVKALREAADATLGLSTGHECRRAILARGQER